MTRVRTLSVLGSPVLLVGLLVLGGMSLTKAQVPTKGKPIKPPAATWAVEGLTGTLSGDGSVYTNGVDSIDVTVEKTSIIGGNRKDNHFETSIRFRIPAPSGRHVSFNGVSLEYLNPNDYDFVDPDIGYPCCVFPTEAGECGVSPVANACAACSCMATFMNGASHPYVGDPTTSTYAFFLIEIHAFDKDLLTMADGEKYQLGQTGHLNDYIVMSLRYQTGDRAPVFHNIDLSKSAHLGEQSRYPFNIWITRTDGDSWIVEVGRGTERETQQFLYAEEYYYDPGRGGGRRNLWYSTLFQGGYFAFTLDLKRTSGS